MASSFFGFKKAARGALYPKPTAESCRLSWTNFATLYSINHYSDDFADAFANYVHTELLHRPYRVTITVPDAAPLHYTGCWQQTRCAAKRTMIERMLGIPTA